MKISDVKPSEIARRDYSRLKPTNDNERELIDRMAWITDARRHFYENGNYSGYKFICFEEFILKHGQLFPRAAAPPPVRPMPRECFHQSYRLTTRKNSRWIYCEGFGLGSFGMPVHHAWVTKRDAPGEAFDLAWGPDHTGAAYVGIMFKPEFVRETRAASKDGEFSVLDAWWQRYPLMTGKVKIEDVRW